MYIYPYNMHSESVKALSEALGARRIKETNSKFKGSLDKIVLNWGNSTHNEEVALSTVINHPFYVGQTTNKRKFFDHINCSGLEFVIPPYTTNKGTVHSWLDQNHLVVVRHILQGHSGEGIELLKGADTPIPDAPLYTLYIPKKDEYRVHLFKNKQGLATVFDVQRKARNTDVPDENVNWRIRNHDNGFVYVRNDIDVPPVVIKSASIVFLKTSLDFCAMDVIYNEKRKAAFVLEGNTAPGLTGTTLENYVKMFKENFL